MALEGSRCRGFTLKGVSGVLRGAKHRCPMRSIKNIVSFRLFTGYVDVLFNFQMSPTQQRLCSFFQRVCVCVRVICLHFNSQAVNVIVFARARSGESRSQRLFWICGRAALNNRLH